jgi:pimeloyl-ACP methyl ester carboxylesterase
MKLGIFLALIGFALTTNGQNNNIKGRWNGSISKDGKNWQTEVNIYSQQHELKGDFDLPDYGLHHLTFSKIQVTDTTITFQYKDKNSEATFKGVLKGDLISGEWKGLGMKANFSLKKMSNMANQFRTEEVTFTNGEAILSGTLILPTGRGPYPAFVQVHGSGNQTRSEDFYKSRAYLFARHGIAVLIYDRRGKGESTGSGVSMERLADDAIAGIHLLQLNPLINKNKIGIMGFSQGGYVAPLAASRSNDIAFVVVGSAPGITPNEQNDFDVENALRSKKLSEDSISLVLKFRKEILDYQYNQKGDKDDLETRLANLRSKGWFKYTLLTDALIEPADEGVREWLSFDPLPVWKKVKVPKLLVWGELDNVVPVQKSKKLIEASLNSAGFKNFKMKVYENASHGIAVVNNKEWDWPRLAEGYHQMLIDWTTRIIK